jgi:DNA (cytosine-5)-methyltransferase 1
MKKSIEKDMKELNYIDLFAGAGGLSEGFIREGFNPIAHVEMNKDACDTIKTRTAYHWFEGNRNAVKL